MQRHDRYDEAQSDEAQSDQLPSEQIPPDQLPEDEWEFGEAFASLFDTDPAIGNAIGERVESRLRARSGLETFTELLGVGWTTLTTLLIDEPPRADWNEQGR